METFLGIGLGNAAFATVLALAAAAIGARCRRPALVHGLWLIVLLKLLTPPIWRVDARALLPARPAPTEAGALGSEVALAESPGGEERMAPPSGTADAAPGEAAEPTAARPSMDVRERAVSEPPAVASPSPQAPRASVYELPDRWPAWAAAFVWAGGSVILATIILTRVVRFGRLLRYAEPAPDTVQKLTRVIADRIGLASSDVPRVWFVPGAVCPMLWAVGGRPRVLVPRELWVRLGARQRSALLAHELAHLRRGDHWVRLVELLVVVAYWWFPVAWWARRRLREAEEHCCDAWVVWALPAGSGRAYAEAILEAVEFVSNGPRVPALASGMGQFASLKWRLTMISRNEGVPRALSWYGRLTVAAVAGVLLPLAPSQSRAQSSGEAPAATPTATPAVQPAAVAPVTVTVPVPAAVEVAAERAVIAELALRSDDVRDDDDDDDASDSKNKNQDKDKAKIKAYKELKEAKEGKDKEAKEKAAKAKAEADQREARKDEKGAEGDEDLARARAEVRELSKQLEKAAQRLAKLEARRHAGHAEGRAGAARVAPPAAPPVTPMPPMPPQKPNFPQGFPGKPAPMPQGDLSRGRTPDMPGMERAREHRLEAIEQRLQALMREIEAIRRERDAQPRPAPQPQRQ